MVLLFSDYYLFLLLVMIDKLVTKIMKVESSLIVLSSLSLLNIYLSFLVCYFSFYLLNLDILVILD